MTLWWQVGWSQRGCWKRQFVFLRPHPFLQGPFGIWKYFKLRNYQNDILLPHTFCTCYSTLLSLSKISKNYCILISGNALVKIDILTKIDITIKQSPFYLLTFLSITLIFLATFVFVFVFDFVTTCFCPYYACSSVKVVPKGFCYKLLPH